MWGYHDGFGWWMTFGGIGMFLFWGLIVWLVVRLLSRTSPSSSGDQVGPAEIAKRRFASGEITEEELDRILKRLRAG